MSGKVSSEMKEPTTEPVYWPVSSTISETTTLETMKLEHIATGENKSEELIVDAILVIPPSNSSLVVPRNITETEETISNEPIQLQKVKMQHIDQLQQEMTELQQNQYENLEMEREQWALLGHEPIETNEYHCSVDIPLQDDWICDNTQA